MRADRDTMDDPAAWVRARRAQACARFGIVAHQRSLFPVRDLAAHIHKPLCQQFRKIL